MKVSLLSYKYPEIKGSKAGVFAKIPHHCDDYDKRYFETTYKAHYEEKFSAFNPKTTKDLINNNTFCGNESGYKPLDKIRVTTELISEKYKNFNEPKENTAIQRSWEYKKDPAISYIQNASRDSLNETKNSFNIVTNEILNCSIIPKSTIGITKTNSNELYYKRSDINKYVLKLYNLRSQN